MSERIVIGWDCPVHAKGQVSIPKKILEAFGNPAMVRFEYNGKTVVLKCVQSTTDEAKQNATVQKEE